jgi:hypothetical protein
MEIGRGPISLTLAMEEHWPRSRGVVARLRSISWWRTAVVEQANGGARGSSHRNPATAKKIFFLYCLLCKFPCNQKIKCIFNLENHLLMLQMKLQQN